MAKPVAGRQAIDQREDIGGDVLRKLAVVVPQSGVHRLAQGEDLRRRGRLVNGHGKSVATIAPACSKRHRAGSRQLQQGRSVEPLQHDAEAPVQGHLAEHLRHRDRRRRRPRGSFASRTRPSPAARRV